MKVVDLIALPSRTITAVLARGRGRARIYRIGEAVIRTLAAYSTVEANDQADLWLYALDELDTPATANIGEIGELFVERGDARHEIQSARA